MCEWRSVRNGMCTCACACASACTCASVCAHSWMRVSMRACMHVYRFIRDRETVFHVRYPH